MVKGVEAKGHLIHVQQKDLATHTKYSAYNVCIKNSNYLILYILTSTKNASLIITDFLAMVYKNEQPRTASLCRGWTMLENYFNLICR